MVLHLKKVLQCDQQIRFKTVFFWRYHSFKPDTYSVMLPELLPEAEYDRRRVLLAAMGKPAVWWKRPKGRNWTTWTGSVEKDLAPRNIYLHSDLRKAQDRTGWRRRSGMEFANDDDDYIYDSEHRLKWHAGLAWNTFDKIINIKNYFTDLLY